MSWITKTNVKIHSHILPGGVGTGLWGHLVNLCLVPEPLLWPAHGHVWALALTQVSGHWASPRMKLLESYCLHWNGPSAGFEPLVPVPVSLRIPTTVDFRAAGTRGLGPALPGNEGRRRKLRGWRLPSDVPLWKGWQWRDFCQTGSLRGGSLGSQGKIPLMYSKLCPALLLSQASLPQSRAREQLQRPGLALWDL